jgi:hypothetical protein
MKQYSTYFFPPLNTLNTIGTFIVEPPEGHFKLQRYLKKTNQVIIQFQINISILEVKMHFFPNI